jgi:ABC-2 type transport system ATP-binding protein
MPPDADAVVIRDLTRRFGAFTAVDRITLSVASGEVFGFLGPNGAGKSTTIRMLCGILPPSGGSATVAGFDVGSRPEAVKSHIGYMSQKFSLYEDLTVEENIDFFGGIYRIPRARRREQKEWVVKMAGLERRRDSLTRDLPAGIRQRLALGCAVLHEPRILFLDEPTSGVDPIARRAFWDLIYELAGNGVTVFVTTHYMDEAEYCDRLALIYRGELVALGTPRELKTEQMREAVLEVDCDRQEDAVEILLGIDGVREAALFGTRIHVVAAEPEAIDAAIRRALADGGHRVEAVRRILPSLEDVFVSVVEARDRELSSPPEVHR